MPKLSNTVFFHIPIMDSSSSNSQGKMVEIVQEPFCDCCMEPIDGTDVVAVGAVFHCCSRCDPKELMNVIIAAIKTFGVWKRAGGKMPPFEFSLIKPLGPSVQLPNGLYMGPPSAQINTVISMLKCLDVDRNLTLICTMLALCNKAFAACDTPEKRVMVENKIVLGFLISVIAQSDYDAQTGQ